MEEQASLLNTLPRINVDENGTVGISKNPTSLRHLSATDVLLIDNENAVKNGSFMIV